MKNSRGLKFLPEVRECMPQYIFDIGFDVGANIGQSLQQMHAIFSQVYCFEPIPSTFQILREKFSDVTNAHLFNVALGSQSQASDMLVTKNSTTNRIISSINPPQLGSGESISKVTVTTLDHFCLQNQINKISYLKIDTEGFDLEVLKGSCSMLSSSAVDFVEAEVGMHLGNSTHVYFDKIYSFMSAFDYSFFGFYDQNLEFYHRNPCLRRSNIVWISNKLAKEYKW